MWIPSPPPVLLLSRLTADSRSDVGLAGLTDLAIRSSRRHLVMKSILIQDHSGFCQSKVDTQQFPLSRERKKKTIAIIHLLETNTLICMKWAKQCVSAMQCNGLTKRPCLSSALQCLAADCRRDLTLHSGHRGEMSGRPCLDGVSSPTGCKGDDTGLLLKYLYYTITDSSLMLWQNQGLHWVC